MNPPGLCYSRCGRLVEIYDLVHGWEMILPPYMMFTASPNVISLKHNMVDANVKVGTEYPHAWGMVFPLERWVDLTALITEPNDESIVVD